LKLNLLNIGEMVMHTKIIMRSLVWNVFIWSILPAIGVLAQEKDNNSVIVKTNPPGAMLYFEGENSFVGVTPLKLPASLKGAYKIMATKYGFEKSRMEYFFKGNEKGVMRLRLSPKTRFKAGVRSLVFPGWGQFYSERKTSGILLSLAQLGIGIFTVSSHLKYNEAYTNYKDALNDYENERNITLKFEKYDVVNDKYDKANHAFNKRNDWLYITGGLWLYNFLDSILFFPSYDREIFDKTLPGISTNFHDSSIALTLTIPF